MLFRQTLIIFILMLKMITPSYSSINSKANIQKDQVNTAKQPSLFFYELNQSLYQLTNTKKDLDQFTKFKKIHATSNDLDTFGVNLGNKLSEYIKNDKILTGYHLHLITKTFSSYHMISAENFKFTKSIQPKDMKNFIDLTDSNITKQNLMWLSTRMNLYNFIENGYKVFYKKEGKLRRILKHAYRISKSTKTISKELKKMIKNTFNRKSRKALKNALSSFHANKKELNHLRSTDTELNYIYNSIVKNPSYQKVLKGKKVYLRGYTLIDAFPDAMNGIINTISSFFGNIMGSLKFRKGYMWKNTKLEQELKSQLKPLDMIFEKTPFIMTDHFIPGYFGHVALWLGTEQELKSLGMWDHPSISKYQEQIKKGYSIVEALRPGVGMNTMSGFMNIDHLSILRVKNILEQKEKLPGIYTRALQTMGKDYDFNFDVETPDKIVCSELIYQAFGHIRFPIKYRLGRPTIEPDLVAEINFYENSPLEFITFKESFSKEDIQDKNNINLANRLSFKVNQDQSDQHSLVFKKKEKVCRSAKFTKKRRNKVICTYEYRTKTYVAPDPIANVRHLP